MRDGHGRQLSPEETAKVKAVETHKDGSSLNLVSIDPRAAKKPADEREHEPRRKAEQEPAPGF